MKFGLKLIMSRDYLPNRLHCTLDCQFYLCIFVAVFFLDVYLGFSGRLQEVQICYFQVRGKDKVHLI